MGRTACTELQCLYNGALYFYTTIFLKKEVIYFISYRTLAQICIYCPNLNSGEQLDLVHVNHSFKRIHWLVCRSIISSNLLLLSLPTTIPK